ncbi:helix-turn-helix domain-containing protein [Methyloterricola oryzae]|uniref:helix-turn-helix domain-containing protein n=1 Tax=Methyloterricola oryzae TaxID=1495050 RepID=UPI0009E5818F
MSASLGRSPIRAIRETRRTKQLTQRKLSLAIGLQQASISRIENGKKEVRLWDLRRIAKALGVSLGDVVDD